MKTLKYWYITAVRKGEWKGCIAHGIVHGHQRLADGIKIHTSAISTVTIVNDTAIIKTKNSEYYCRLNEAFFHLFDEPGKRYFPNFEELRETYERRLEVPGQRDGVLIVLDSEAEYYYIGATFRCGGENIEIRIPTVHIGTFCDSVLIGCLTGKTRQAIDYRYFPFSDRVEFYSWTNELDTYITNAGTKKMKVEVKGRENMIEPGCTLMIPSTKDRGGEGDV